MKKWADLSSTEKFLIGFILILILAIALNFSRVKKGIEKGLEPYKKEQTQK